MDIINQILSIIGALLVLNVFVFVHEFGHYYVAKKLHFRIVEFAIGFGPKIFKREKNGILYSVRALPLGGMCQFYGEDSAVEEAGSFNTQKIWKRVLVIAAGPAMNIITAFLFSILTVLAFGEYGAKKIESVQVDSPAQAAALQAGDIITAIDGHKLQLSDDATERILAASPGGIMLTFTRNGEEMQVFVQDIYNADSGHNILGIQMSYVRTRLGFFESVEAGVRLAWKMVESLVSFLGQLFTGGISTGDVMGPVGTISIIGMAVRTGLESVMRLAVLISINLGMINLVPFPGLDGFRLGMLGIEGIRKKPFPREKEGMVNFIGLMLLFAFIIVVTFGDIQRLWGS